MKAVFIVFNQANTERVYYMLDVLKIRGYSFWENVEGQGSVDGEPRHGSHTWPEMNSAIITIIPDDQVPDLLDVVKKLDERNKEIGVRAFAWNISDIY